MIIAHLRDAIPREVIRTELAKLFGLPVEAIADPEEEYQGQPLLLEHFCRKRGFRTSVTLYFKGPIPRPIPMDDLELARMLARHFSQDVLANPPASTGEESVNPYLWRLIRPSGEIYRVSQVAPLDDESLVIDEHPERMLQLMPSQREEVE